MSGLPIISKTSYQAKLESGESLEPKYGYPSVILLPDDTVLKLWAKRPGILSSGRWHPYSNRFVKHAEALRGLKVPVPKIIDHMIIEGTSVRVVHYHSLTGESVRSLLHREPSKINIPALAKFYKSLHDLGINFKGANFGNLIQISPEKFGLIDFTSLKILPRPLSPKERLRNLERPLSYAKDVVQMKSAGLPDLRDTYLALTKV